MQGVQHKTRKNVTNTNYIEWKILNEWKRRKEEREQKYYV